MTKNWLRNKRCVIKMFKDIVVKNCSVEELDHSQFKEYIDSAQHINRQAIKKIKLQAEQLSTLQAENSELKTQTHELAEALKLIFTTYFTTYKARNGKQVSIEDDNGLCYIVPSDSIHTLEKIYEKLCNTGGVQET